MEELNQLRIAARNRFLLYISLFGGLTIAVVVMSRHFFMLPFLLVFGFVFSAVLSSGPYKRYRTAFKAAFVERSLRSAFTSLYYEPSQGISYDTIAATKMMYMGDRFHSEDYVHASYRDVRFEQSDVHIQDEHHSTDSKGHSSTHYVTIFRGRWMIFDFNKEFRAKVQIVQKGFPTAKRKRFFGKKETLFQKVETESETFNQQFQVYAQNEHDAFYILTPAFMERVQNLTAHNKGKLMFCFIGNRLHIAINDNKDSFEPGSIFKPIDEEKATRKIREEIEGITQFIDELSLDNDLFVQEKNN